VRRCAFVLLALLVSPVACLAHEVRPSFLELRETASGEFEVLWKTPMLGDRRLALEPEFSGDVTATSPVLTRTPPGAAVQTWTIRAPALRGQTLRIAGLEGTMTDALVHLEFTDGSTWTQRLTPHQPAAMIPAHESAFTVVALFLKLGVEHILTGIDHLLFVLALLIIARSRWRLLLTVTAFTVAHSITLALATLGFVHVPQRPVEAAIALSIAFVAAEIVRGRQGAAGVTARAPWIVAFAFGLLHGFGFAGALSEVGLPQGRIPLALLFFNLGVELGQLLFIAGALSLIAAIRRLPVRFPGWSELVPPYVIGSMSMFWMLQRIAAF
jgi:hydrogenase/urease accessory protein HupE